MNSIRLMICLVAILAQAYSFKGVVVYGFLRCSQALAEMSAEKVKAFVLKNFVILGLPTVITFGLIPSGLLLGAVKGQLLRQSGVRSEDEALGQGQ
eukprot:5686700-Amphidinium_carterae.1